MRRQHALAAGLVVAFLALGHRTDAQGPARPQPTCIRNVGLPTEADPDARATIVLRDGRIDSILPADAPAPPGTREIDGTGLLAEPAFLDAYSRKGVETPDPVVDQDHPYSETSDVYVDMRLANRKGIEPAFQAADALAISKEAGEAWRKAGFGVALVAPGGELLAGDSVLATTRDAAPRDLVVKPEVFAHAAFQASGPGYPSTLMGYIAQLRQFFLDVRWQAERERRFEEGRPGGRPPFDEDLEAARPLLRGERTLACEADQGRYVERWMHLADQFGLSIAVVGGNETGKIADVLAARDVPVVLTLDWGKEVKDPRPKEAKEKAEEMKPDAGEKGPGASAEEAAAKPGEAAAVEAQAAKPAAAPQQGEKPEQGEKAEPGEEPEPAQETPAEEKGEEPAAEEAESGPRWDYVAPLAERIEKRRLWEERRDTALRLSEAGVHIAFGSAGAAPKDLLEHVRTLVEVGLPVEKARAALTTEAARLLGVERRLGRIAPGFDATLMLWTADPLVSKDAQVAWSVVDGWPSEFELEKKKAEKNKAAADGETVDCAGSWRIESEMRGETRESTLVLKQTEEGELSGTLTSQFGGEERVTELTGKVTGATIALDGTFSVGDSEASIHFEGQVAGDSLDGSATYHFPFADEPFEASVSGTRVPEVLLELETHSYTCEDTEVSR